jgi:6-pyruvoyl-tetrahydropterin synthase
METFSLFIKDFTHLDGAVLDPQRGMIGYSLTLGIEFVGSVNKEGVVFDFSKAKKLAKKVVDNTADHALTVAVKDVIYVDDERVKVEKGLFSYTCPRDAIFIVETVSQNQLVAKLESLIFAECKKDSECSELESVKITATPEKYNGTNNFYRYTHGLKDSCSKCERPGHGHRSTIAIWINDKSDKKLEETICGIYDDKHLVWNKNIKNKTDETIEIEYTTNVGTYNLVMPIDRVVIYPIETTVENIAKVTAHLIKSYPTICSSDRVIVDAYEGIEKGCRYVLTGDFDENLKIVIPKLIVDSKTLLKG